MSLFFELERRALRVYNCFIIFFLLTPVCCFVLIANKINMSSIFGLEKSALRSTYNREGLFFTIVLFLFYLFCCLVKLFREWCAFLFIEVCILPCRIMLLFNFDTMYNFCVRSYIYDEAFRFVIDCLFFSFRNVVCFAFAVSAWHFHFSGWVTVTEQIVFIAPLCEEVVKSIMGCGVFGVMEFFTSITFESRLQVIARLLPLGMHLLTGRMSFVERLCFHVWWNFMATHVEAAFLLDIYGMLVRGGYQANVDHASGGTLMWVCRPPKSRYNSCPRFRPVCDVWNPFWKVGQPFNHPRHMDFAKVVRPVPNEIKLRIFSYLGGIAIPFCQSDGLPCHSETCFICNDASYYLANHYTADNILQLCDSIEAVYTQRRFDDAYVVVMTLPQLLEEALLIDGLYYVQQGKKLGVVDSDEDDAPGYYKSLVARSGGGLKKSNKVQDSFEDLDRFSMLNPSAAPFVPRAASTQFRSPRIIQNSFAACIDPRDMKNVRDELVASGFWPEFLIDRYYRTAIHHLEAGEPMKDYSVAQVAKDTRRFEESDQPVGRKKKMPPIKISSAPASKDNSFKKYLKENNFWKVPIVPMMAHIPVPERPTSKTWTPSKGRTWVLVMAAHKWVPGRRGNFAVLGNHSAKFIFEQQDPLIHSRVLAAALADASVWFGDMNAAAGKMVGEAVLSDFMTREQKVRAGLVRSLRLFGSDITTVDELETFAPMFRRHKIIFKTCKDYLSGLTVDEMKLRSSIKQHLDGKVLKQGFLDDFSANLPGSEDFLKFLCETLVSTESSAELPLDVVKFFTMLITLSQQTTLVGVVGVLTQWGLGHPFFREFLTTLSNLRLYDTQGESDSFFNWKMGDMLKTKSGSLVFDALLCGGGMIFASHVLGSSHFYEDNIADAVYHLSTQLKIDTTKTVAERVFQMFWKFCDMLLQCVKDRSLMPLLAPRMDPVRWRFECEAPITYSYELVANVAGVNLNSKRIKELRDKELIPEYWNEQLTHAQFKDHIDDLHRRGTKLLKWYSGSQVGRDIERTLTKLTSFQAAFSNGYSVMANRMAPWAVYIDGPAGAGKTNFSNDIARAIARHRGYSLEAICFYDWLMNANFQDGLGPSQWVIRADDIDQDPAPAVRGTQSHVGVVLDVVNNKPFPVEQSDVAMKGKIAARPLLFMMMSNYPMGRLEKYALCPMAFWRRFPLKVHVRAKDQYARAIGSGIMDPAKIGACTDGELWDFSVGFFDPTCGDPGQPFLPTYTAPVQMSRSELLKKIVSLYDIHMLEQSKTLTRFAEGGAFCDKCYSDLAPDGSGCSCVRPQGSAMVLTGAALLVTGFTAYKAVRTFHRRYSQVARIIDCADGGVSKLKSILDMYREAKITVCSFAPLVGKVAMAAMLAKVLHMGYNWHTQVAQGREHNSTGVTPFEWKRADQTFNPGLPSNAITYTKEELCKQVQSCMVEVLGACAVSGLIVAHNCVLTVYHAVSYDGKATIKQGMVTMQVELGPVTRVRLGDKDLALIRVSHLIGVPSILKKIWYDVDSSISQFDELELLEDDVSKWQISTVNRFVNLPDVGRVLSSDIQTVTGDCGRVYIARFGTGWRIVGMHSGALTSFVMTQTAIGQIVTSSEIERYATQVTVVPQGVEIPLSQTSLHPELQEYVFFPPKSEVWSAVSHFGVQVKCIGTAKFHVHGATMKSKCRPTLYAEDFRDLEELWCGQRNYWVRPEFKGEMIDERWVSTYTRSLTYLNRDMRDEEFFWLSLLDYVAPFSHLSCDGYRELSEQEIMVGVPHTVIGGADLSTSTGMPFNRKKKNFMAVINGECYMHEKSWEIYDEFVDCYKRHVIPAPVVLATGKDEPIKHTKLKTHDERVFACMPHPWNGFSKGMSGPWKAFMRSNPFVFECMVGINMTSNECNGIVKRLAAVCPNLDRILETDIEKLDKSFDGVTYEYVSFIVYYLSWLLGLDKLRGYCIIHAVKNSVWIIKNDFFQMGGMNPSGNDLTVELNSFEGSLHERRMYYRMKYPDGLPASVRCDIQRVAREFLSNPAVVMTTSIPFTFRRDVALVIYGDDKLASVAGSCDFYDADRIVPLGLEHGIRYTDGQKSDNILWRKLSEVSFLKRGFVWDDELHSYITPLSVKALAKMLVMAKDSTLSEKDHCSALLSDVLRESVYHGRDFHDGMLRRCVEAAEKYGLVGNGYFRYDTYDVCREMMKRGAFQTWDLRRSPGVPTIEGVYVNQGKELGNMSTNQGIELKPSVAELEPSHEAKTEVDFEIGAMHEESEEIVDGFTPTMATQKMPVTELGNFMERMAAINIFTMTSTDAPLTIVQTMDPWALFLANAAVADKTANFAYIRGTIEVTLLVACPAGSYGLYVMSAVPDGTPPPAGNIQVAAIQPYETCLQTPNIRLDVSSATNGKLTLPFIWPYDYAALPTGPNLMWTLNLFCLQAISSATSDVTLTGTIKTYARILDCELVVPINQGKKFLDDKRDAINDKVKKMTGGKKGSEIASSVAGMAAKAAMVPMLAPFAGPIATGAAALATAMDWFGFTRTTDEQTPTPVMHRPFSNVANMDANDTSEIAALSVANTVSYDPGIAGVDHADPCAFESIFAHWSLTNVFTWTTSMATGVEIGTIPVTPFTGVARSITDASLTAAGYVGLPFTYWRGDMEYMILIPVSKFHRGSIQLSWAPIGNSTGEITNTRLNQIVDVTASKEWAVSVGYARELPFLESRIVNTFVPTIIPVGACLNGYIDLRVVNPLTAPVAVAPATVFVFARAKANMTFAVPKDMELTTDGAGLYQQVPFYAAYVTQGGALGDEVDLVQEIVLVPDSGEYKSTEILFGENVRSVRALVQKPTQMKNLQALLTSIPKWIYLDHFAAPPCLGQLNSIGNSTTASNRTCWTWMGWYRVLFTGVAGSTRYKVVNTLDGGTYPVTISHVTTYTGLAVSAGSIADVNYADPSPIAPVWSVASGDGVEVTVPYYSPVKYQLGRTIVNAANSQTTAPGGRIDVIGFPPPSAAAPTNFMSSSCIYLASGPDFRPTMFRFVPRVQIVNTGVHLCSYGN